MKAAAWLASLLLLAPLASAEWLQVGGAPTRNSFHEGSGPAWPDIALRIDVGAGRIPSYGGELSTIPLVVADGKVYFVANGGTEVSRLEIASGVVEPFWAEDATAANREVGADAVTALASDGESLFMEVSARGTLAISLKDGRELWRSEIAPGAGAGDVSHLCTELVVTDEHLVSACLVGIVNAGWGGRVVLVARGIATGEQVWTREVGREVSTTGDLPGPTFNVESMSDYTHLDGFSIVGPYAYVSFTMRGAEVSFTEPYAPQAARCQPNLAAVGIPDGPGGWMTYGADHWASNPGRTCDSYPAPVGGDGLVWYNAGPTIETLSDDEPRVPAHANDDDYPLAADNFNGNEAPGLAYDGRAVYAPYLGSLWAFPPDISTPIWEFQLPAGARFVRGPILVDESAVYARSDEGILYALDKRDGAPLWKSALRLDAFAPDGERLVGISDRDVVVLGTTSYGLGARAASSNAYPAVGDEVSVDLSGTPASPLGPPTEFAVDWGDGTPVRWSEDPVQTHRYGTNGDYVARGLARNEANQTGSVALSYFVGRDPPNFVAAQFSSANQERTFFLLGLLVTGAFAAFGLWRVQRRRSLLSRELAALEAAVGEAKGDAVKLDRALDERRFRARSLLLDHRLDEGQHSVLATRIEELSRTGRLDVAERILDFLPHRHVKALREMLRDGRVSSLERAHFLQLLDADAVLTEEYKARVRVVVEAWASHDGAGEGRA